MDMVDHCGLQMNGGRRFAPGSVTLGLSQIRRRLDATTRAVTANLWCRQSWMDGITFQVLTASAFSHPRRNFTRRSCVPWWIGRT